MDRRKEPNEKAIELLVKTLPGCELSNEDSANILNIYGDLIGLENSQSNIELMMSQKQACDNQFDKEKNLTFLINHSKHYEVLNSLFRLIAAANVSNAEAERTFSALKRIKMPLRSTMKEDRLNSIVMAAMNADLLPETENIFIEFVNRAVGCSRRVN